MHIDIGELIPVLLPQHIVIITGCGYNYVNILYFCYIMEDNMGQNAITYTGTLVYKEINFQFVFSENRLKLIPQEDSLVEIKRWYSLETEKEQMASYLTHSAILRVEVPYLTGHCFETNYLMVFFCKNSLLRINSIFNPRLLFVDIQAYIRLDTSEDQVNRISFRSTEISCIYKMSRAIENVEYEDLYEKSIKLRSPDETRTSKQSFYVDDRKVEASFDIYKQYSNMNNEQPITVYSTMLFFFNSTKDYEFIYRLYRLALVFIQYLCYRKNVLFQEINLDGFNENKKYHNIGELFILDDYYKGTEPDVLRRGVYIDYEYFQGCESQILADLAIDALYSRHIPRSYRESRYIDAARAIMITAAFESIYEALYPEGCAKSQKSSEAFNAVRQQIGQLVEISTGKQKTIYKHLLKQIGKDSFENAIVHALEELSIVLENSKHYIHGFHEIATSNDDIADRLKLMRNAYAHGHLNYELSGIVMLDILLLQELVYALQLRKYGISDKKIALSLFNLFHR